MRYVLIMVLLCCLGSGLGAQVQKGDCMLGGSFHYKRVDYSRSHYNILNAIPEGGYFLNNRLSLTGYATFSWLYWRSRTGGADVPGNTRFGGGLALNFYYGKKKSSLQPFIYAGARRVVEAKIWSQEYDQRYASGYDVGAGLHAFIRPDVALDFRYNRYFDTYADRTFGQLLFGIKAFIKKDAKQQKKDKNK